MLKGGDIIYCKKDFWFSDSCYCTRKEIYLVEYISYGCVCITSVDNANISADYSILEEDQTQDIKYVWDHFETKIDRVKRFIKEYENR